MEFNLSLSLLLSYPGQSGYVGGVMKRGFFGGLPWRSSGWDSVLPLQGARVPSLIGVLRSHMLRGAAKKKERESVFWSPLTWGLGLHPWLGFRMCGEDKQSSADAFTTVLLFQPQSLSHWSTAGFLRTARWLLFRCMPEPALGHLSVYKGERSKNYKNCFFSYWSPWRRG